MSPATCPTVRFSAFLLFFWGAMVAIEGFLVPYLTHIGFGERQAGLVMGAVFLVSVGSSPLWGYLADRTGRHKTIIMSALFVSIGAVCAIPASGTVFGLIVLFVLLYSLTANSMPALIDSWIMHVRRGGQPVSYGVARGFGSLGYSAAGAALGIVLDRHGLGLLFPSFAVLTVVVLLIGTSIRVGDGGRRPAGSRPEQTMPRAAGPVASEAVSPRSAVRAVVQNRRFVILLISAFLVFMGTRAAMTFLPLRYYSMGGSTVHVGWSQSINAASEIPFLFLSVLIIRRMKPRLLILLGMVFFTIRLVLVRLAPTPELMLLAQILQGPALGFMLPATVIYIDLIAPEQLRSLFQTLAPSVYFGLGSVVGSTAGGAIIERLGLDMLYTAAPIVAALGTCVFALSLVTGRSRRE